MPGPGLQIVLAELGFYFGPLIEPGTEADADAALGNATRRFQEAHGLAITGLLDEPTTAALAREERRLHPRGDFPGPSDGPTPDGSRLA